MLEYCMNVKLPAEHPLEFLSLKGDCTGSSESTLVKMPHFWKSHSRLIYEFQVRKQSNAIIGPPAIGVNPLRAILCKYGASYIGTISRSDSDFDETC